MHILKLLFKNAFRHRLRTGLTILGITIAILAFGLLRTVISAWYSGVEASSATRLITRNAVSLIFSLPLSYKDKIRQVPGVTIVSYGNWFGGIYIDERNFFPQFAVSLPKYLEIYPEYMLPPEQQLELLQDRRGCVAGRQLAERYGWRLGDAIVIKGTIFPGEYRFILRAVYRGRDPTTDENRLMFHWDYLNETMKKTFPARADQVGWFLSQVAAPDLAPTVAAQIDDLFKNSLAETLSESEAAFQMGFVSMTEALLLAIKVVSWLVIGVILVLLANTMAMSARERLGEYAVLKTMGYRPRHLAGLIMGESLMLAAMGGLLGLALTFPMVYLFKTRLGQYFRIFPLTDTTLALGLAIALAVGVLAAVLPAWRAARVGIAEALRKVG
jgi:putative ABC transport system permease protein